MTHDQAQAHSSESPAAERKPGRRLFTNGDPTLPKCVGEPVPESPQDLQARQVLDDGVPDQLVLMRLVLKNPPAPTESQEIKTLRRWLKQDLKGFMAAKTQLELKLLAARARANDEPMREPEVEEETDEGTERCIALCEKLLADFAAPQGE
jgi:hypothetical protein